MKVPRYVGVDIIGNIAVLMFAKPFKAEEKRALARKLLAEHKNIKSVYEKAERIKGRLRKAKFKWLAGRRDTVSTHKENSCVFRLDIAETYFSPRLANERLEIAKQVKPNETVLVMFAGVAPYGIVIAKLAKPKKVICIEINRKACKFAKENVKLNKLENLVEIVQGDVKRIASKFAKQRKKFDRIVMPRPQLREKFLHEAFILAKPGTIVHFYDFGSEKKLSGLLKNIEIEARKHRRKIQVLNVKKAGEVAPKRYRWRIDFRIVG